MQLNTNFMGLSLKNPLIVASSVLTSSVEKIKACEAAGAGAVVVKSLFEEQINNDQQAMLKDMDYSIHADAYDFLNQASEDYYLDQYLTIVEEAQKAVSIPVIPSLNCVSSGNWLEYAKKFEAIGCQAIELNLFILPADIKKGSVAIEKNYYEIASQIKKTVSIPVALKLGSYFSGLANSLYHFSDEIGIDGLVLFNRFFRNDIDINTVKLIDGKSLSASVEMEHSMQWISLLSGEIKADLVAATGIHSSEAIIKQILVGAKAVQLCSILLEKGVAHLSVLLKEIEDWMQVHHYQSIQEFNGLLSQKQSSTPDVYERVQYVKSLVDLK